MSDVAPVNLTKILVSDGKGAYLILRSSEWPENPRRSLQPDLPGGVVENGESSVEGAIRELAEETGLIMNHSDLTLVYEGDESHENRSYHRSVYTALCENPKLKLSWEHDKYWWMNAHDILDLKMREPYPRLFKFLHEKGFLI